MPVGPSYREVSRPYARAESASYAEPVTGVGRVCGVSASSAPERDDDRHVELGEDRDQLVAERRATACSARCPRIRTTSRSLPGGRATEIRVVGHSIRRLTPPISDTVGPVDLEVVVVLGVERGQRLGVPDQLEMLERARRGVPGVVPALERDDHHRVVQLGQVLRG